MGILGLLRWLACDGDLVTPSIARLVGRGGGYLVVHFMAKDDGNFDLGFLKQLGIQP